MELEKNMEISDLTHKTNKQASKIDQLTAHVEEQEKLREDMHVHNRKVEQDVLAHKEQVKQLEATVDGHRVEADNLRKDARAADKLKMEHAAQQKKIEELAGHKTALEQENAEHKSKIDEHTKVIKQHEETIKKHEAGK